MQRPTFFRYYAHFERFVAEYEERFEKEYGFCRPTIKDVVEKHLDCGNPRCGFARIRCPRCRAEHLLMFSCKTRGFCPSCHAKRLEECGERMRQRTTSSEAKNSPISCASDGDHHPGQVGEGKAAAAYYQFIEVFQRVPGKSERWEGKRGQAGGVKIGIFFITGDIEKGGKSIVF